jgi:hypothetical protein
MPLAAGHTLGPHLCVQREVAGPATHPAAPSLVREVLNSPGQPLDAATRSLMEPRFGYDFSHVRVHSDQHAAESARAVGANAYTAGSHIVFGSGQDSPGTARAQRLMAHELTHVVQQASGPVEGTPMGDGLSVSHPEDRSERHAAASAEELTANRGTKPRLPRQPTQSRSRSDGIHLQRDAQDTSAGAGVASAIGGGFSALFAGIALIPAFESAAYAKRQAVAGERQAVAAEAGLDIARRQAEAAENPPVPAPTTGGIVVNNNNGYGDIPSSSAPAKSTARAGESAPTLFKILKVSQGPNNFANFNANVTRDGKDIKGGNFEDGEAKGYLGGSAASNLSVSLKAIAGPPAPFEPPKGKPTTIASIRFLISGTNIVPRTKTETPIQRFSGSVTVPASGTAIPNEPFNVNPGSKVKNDGISAPAVSIDLPTSAPAPGGAPAPAPATPKAAGAGSPAPAAGGPK